MTSPRYISAVMSTTAEIQVSARWVERPIKVVGVGTVAHGLRVRQAAATERHHGITVDDDVAILILDLTRALNEQRSIGAYIDGDIGHFGVPLNAFLMRGRPLWPSPKRYAAQSARLSDIPRRDGRHD